MSRGVKQVRCWSAAVLLMVLATWGVGTLRAESGHPVDGTIDVVVETRDRSGVLVSTEKYQQAYVLDEGGVFFDDFSTRIRFKFLTITSTKVDGENTIAMNWFADISVFNSVDLDTSVVLGEGVKSGRATGRHTLYTSGGSVTTRYTLTASER